MRKFFSVLRRSTLFHLLHQWRKSVVYKTWGHENSKAWGVEVFFVDHRHPFIRRIGSSWEWKERVRVDDHLDLLGSKRLESAWNLEASQDGSFTLFFDFSHIWIMEIFYRLRFILTAFVRGCSLVAWCTLRYVEKKSVYVWCLPDYVSSVFSFQQVIVCEKRNEISGR